MALPEIQEGFSEQNTVIKDNRERLQKSLRAGQLNIVKSIDLGFKGLIAFEKIKLEQQKIQEGFLLEALREAGRAKDGGGAQGSGKKVTEKDGMSWLVMLGLATALLGGIAKGIVDAIRAWGKTVKGVLKTLLLPFKIILTPLVNLLKGPFTKEGAIGKLFASIGNNLRTWATNAGTRLTALFNLLKGPFTAEGSIGKLFASIKSTLSVWATNASTRFTSLFNVLKGPFTAEGSIGKIFTSIKTTLSTWGTNAAARLATLGEALKGPIGKDGAITKMMNSVKAMFSEGGVVSKLVGGVKNIFSWPFEPLLKPHTQSIKGIFAVGDDAGPLAKIIAAVKAPFTTAITTVKTVMLPITNLFGEGGTVSKLMGKFSTAFKIFKEGSGLMKTLSAVGRVLGRIFFPLTIIIAIWDTVKGAIEGFEKDGFLGGIQGALAGLLGSLVGMPLDLLKSAVSWIAGKLGFKNAEKFLDSFSITDIMKSIITEPVNMLKSVANGVLDFLADKAMLLANMPGLGTIMTTAAEKLRGFKFKTETVDIGGVDKDLVKLTEQEQKEADRASELALAAQKKALEDKQAETDRMEGGLAKQVSDDAAARARLMKQISAGKIQTGSARDFVARRRDPAPAPVVVAAPQVDSSTQVSSSIKQFGPKVTPDYQGGNGAQSDIMW